MASNFKVFVHQIGENMHLNLIGGFNGSSAYELIKIIDKYYDDRKKIFVHTSGLLAAHSCGIDILKTKYSRHKKLFFNGEPGRKM